MADKENEKKLLERIERLEKRSKLMADFIDKTVKETKEKLWSHGQTLQCAARHILRIDDRIAALESERGIAIAAYSKTHPEEMRELNKVLGIKSDRKKSRVKKARN